MLGSFLFPFDTLVYGIADQLIIKYERGKKYDT
jgi:hypothetical protein